MRDKIKGTLAALAPITQFVFYRNSAPHTSAERAIGLSEPILNNPNITHYVGNFPESFAVTAVSGIVGDLIQQIGKNRGNKKLEKIGAYFPEITSLAVSSYFSLGETIIPQMLPGHSDPRDVPAVVLSALAGYTLAKVGRRSGFNKRLYELGERI